MPPTCRGSLCRLQEAPGSQLLPISQSPAWHLSLGSGHPPGHPTCRVGGWGRPPLRSLSTPHSGQLKSPQGEASRMLLPKVLLSPCGVRMRERKPGQPDRAPPPPPLRREQPSLEHGLPRCAPALQAGHSRPGEPTTASGDAGAAPETACSDAGSQRGFFRLVLSPAWPLVKSHPHSWPDGCRC